MSPRAACRLESLGFTAVHDYAAGKTDWTGSGLPIEGTHAELPRAGHLAREIATCGLNDDIGTARKAAGEAGICLVTDGNGIVLGRLRGKELEKDDASRVEEVMEAGPTTVRYDEPLPDLVERMQKNDVGSMVVTKPSGQLIGVMQRIDAEELLAELHRAHQEHHDD